MRGSPCSPKRSYPGTRVGSPSGRSLVTDGRGARALPSLLDASVDVPGPAVDRLAEAAAENGLHLVIGVVERDGGTLYCTALFFSPDGYLGKHRKLMPTAAERLVWGFGDGSTLPVFDTPLGRIGAVICWENYMPLLRMAMYAKRIQLWCAPTADSRETWLSTMRHVALEGRCFVLSCNQFTRRRDFPSDIPNTLADAPDDVVSSGGSCIIGPLGEVLAGPARDGEEILYADIDLGDIARGKYDFDVVGHYARPDIFTLSVNEQPSSVVLAPGSQVEQQRTDIAGEVLKLSVRSTSRNPANARIPSSGGSVGPGGRATQSTGVFVSG